MQPGRGRLRLAHARGCRAMLRQISFPINVHTIPFTRRGPLRTRASRRAAQIDIFTLGDSAHDGPETCSPGQQRVTRSSSPVPRKTSRGTALPCFPMTMRARRGIKGPHSAPRRPHMPIRGIRDSGYKWPVAFVCAAALSAAVAIPRPTMMRISRQNLCVTEGNIESAGDKLTVDVPKMRAYVNQATPQIVEAHFTFLGPTGKDIPLGSGEMRRQFGLKLRAGDACNLVYAMWRIEPQSKLVVSVKSNPGQHSSAECGNRGYTNIKPAKGSSVPILRPGSPHVLRAEMNGEQLKIFVD